MCVSWYLTPKTHISKASAVPWTLRYMCIQNKRKKKKRRKRKKEKGRVTRKIGRFTPCANCISQMIACILHFCVITHSGLGFQVAVRRFAVAGL